ncbi:MAG TPA: S8 family peptidase [Vicinamibacterales bacterium]
MRESLRQHGDKIITEHPSIDAVTATVHCDDLKALEGFASVLSISKDAIVRANAVAPAPPAAAAALSRRDDMKREKEGESAGSEQTTTFATLGVTAARLKSPDFEASYVMLGDVTTTSTVIDNRASDWNGVEVSRTGGGIGVAVIDSGIESGPDFDSRIVAFYDFIGGRVRKTTPSDAYGHGTHVAGLIGSRFVGVAPGIRLIGLRVLDAQGLGQTSDVIKAIDFATDNAQALGIRAINLSLGHPVFEPAASDPLVQAVERAVRAGIVVITASGNFGVNKSTGLPGYAGVTSPGNAPSSLTVGAINTFDTVTRLDDRVTAYSSRGPSWYDAFAKPDVSAPGHNMLSVAAKGSYLRKLNEKRGGRGNYMRLSGTSMAAAVATGVVGLVIESNPRLTPNALKMVVEYSAIPVKNEAGKEYDAFTQGAGGVNGSGAIKLASAIDATRPIGSKWLLSGVQPRTTIDLVSYRWAKTILWGPHHVIGDGLIDENRIAWATNIVWGSGVDDYAIVWGNAANEEDNFVWGTIFDEGDNIVWGTNIVWSTAYDESDNIVWGTFFEEDNIVWGTNIVWGNALIGVDEGDNIVWGTSSDEGDNIVWGTMTNANIVFADLSVYDPPVKSHASDEGDNIVWGTALDELDNLVWGATVTGHRPEAGRIRRSPQRSGSFGRSK